MNEIWKPVRSFEGLYEVSNLGNVRSLPRVGLRGNMIGRVYGGRVLRPVVKRSFGYYCVTLRSAQRSEQRFIHTMVLEAFIAHRPAGAHCCHNNGVRTDNRIENLRWGTPAENVMDMARHGTKPLGETVHNAKLTAEQVKLIRASTEKQAVLAARYGVTQACISRIQLRKVWAHI